MQLALNKETNDLFKPAGGGVTRVDEGRYTVQLVRNRLQTSLGEWLLDPDIGWLNINDFEKGYDLFDIELRAIKVILETTGVQSVDEIDLNMQGRKLYLTFKATTIYGTINETVPWGV